MDKSPMEELALTLFVDEKTGHVNLSYPFLFMCMLVGVLVRGYQKLKK